MSPGDLSCINCLLNPVPEQTGNIQQSLTAKNINPTILFPDNDMTFSRRQITERRAIEERPNRRPYASKVAFELNRGGFEFPESCSILAANGSVIELLVADGRGVNESRQVNVSVRGFATASIAEENGLKLSQAILWAAITRRVALRLNYHTPHPSIVFDRTVRTGGGPSVSASGYVYSKFEHFVESVKDVFDSDDAPNLKLLVSMELFTSARLESTERTRFLGMVSSLEPIAEQLIHAPAVVELVDGFIQQLNGTAMDESVKNSLRGSIQRLKQESVGFAIKRMIHESFPNETSAVELVTHAYQIRSSLLHDGHADADLNLIAHDLEQLIRRLIAVRLGKQLG